MSNWQLTGPCRSFGHHHWRRIRDRGRADRGVSQARRQLAFVQRSDATSFCDRMEEATGHRPLFIACDITDTASLKAAIAKAADLHGPITVLVNNAANDQRHDTLTVDEASGTGRSGSTSRATSSRTGRDFRACALPVGAQSSTSPRSAT